MRQGQQGRRGRNRGSGGGRKPQNSISRNYESSGPDIKIRGTAMHIAEKYSSLARDAMASGDIIGAENYLQHAEHYNRIVMAAQAAQAQAQPSPQQPQSHDGPNGASGNRGPYPDFLYREVQPSFDDSEGDEEDAPQANGHHAQPYQRPRAAQRPRPARRADQPSSPPGNGDQPVVVEADQPSEASSPDEQGERPRRRRRRPAPGVNGNGREHTHVNGSGETGPEGDDSAPDEATA